MASSDPQSYGARRSPLIIDTSNAEAMPHGRLGNRGHRFSYVETPIDMQEPDIQPQRFIPGQAPIQESPSSERDPHHGSMQATQASHPIKYNVPAPTHANAAAQPEGGRRTSSPYGVPEPQGTHPAYFAPVASPTSASTPRLRPGSVSPPATVALPPQPLSQSQRTSTVPIQRETDEVLKEPPKPLGRERSQVPYNPDSLASPRQPVFSPKSMVGPNGMGPGLHQPGQIAHPNMNMGTSTGTKDDWIHSLCECNADLGTCFTGFFCPCILDSKTAYRLERRSERNDPTDLLGFSNCNGRCGVMSVFGLCGLFCESLNPTLAWRRHI